MKNKLIMLFADIIIAVAVVLGIWYFGYCVQQICAVISGVFRIFVCNSKEAANTKK